MSIHADSLNKSNMQQVQDLTVYLQQLGSSTEADTARTQEIKNILTGDEASVDRARVMEILIECQDTIWAHSAPREIEGFYLLMGGLLTMIKSGDLHEKLLSFVVRRTDDRTSLRLLVLQGLCNIYNGSDEIQVCYKYMLQFVLDAGLYNAVESELGSLGDRLKSWGVNSEVETEIFSIAADICAASNNKAYLSIMSSLLESTTDIDAVEKHIANVAKEPTLMHYNTLFQTKVIKENLGTFSAELLSLLVTGTLADCESFVAKHDAGLKKYGIEADALKEKVIVGQILDIVVDSMSYADLAKQVGIEESEVENWIIQAISMGFVDARLDQMNSSVSFYRVQPRVFDKENAAALSSKLTQWKQNLNQLKTRLMEHNFDN